MFCPKCGAKAIDGAAFCQKCGAKLIAVEDAAQHADQSTHDRQTQPDTQNIPSDTPHKKKSWKLPAISGAVVLALAAVIFAVSSGRGGGKPAASDSDSPAAVMESRAITGNAGSGAEPAGKQAADIHYEGVALSQLLTMPPEEAIALLGPPAVHDEYKLAYDDIEFTLDRGKISYGESFSPEKFLFSGTPLSQNRPLLLSLLGDPVEEGEGGSGYETTFERDGYSLTIATEGKDGAAWRVFIAPEGGAEAADADLGGLLYKGVTVDQLLGASPDDFISIFGEPDETNYGGEELIYGDAMINIDMWTVAAPYVSGIHSRRLDDFTYNGQPLSDNYDKLTQIIGREPDEARVFGDAYSMSYQWEHGGSPAWLTVDTPAAEGSSAATQAGVSWWVEAEDEYQEPSDAVPGAEQSVEMVSHKDLIGTWQWQGRNVVDAVLGMGGKKQLTFYSNGTCKGEIATSGNVNGEFVAIFAPDSWSFLEYEQILQASAMTTGWDWDSNGTPIEVPVYKTMNFKVSMSGNTMRLENVDNPGSKDIEYIKAE